MKKFFVSCIIVFSASISHAQETRGYDVVTEFIRELGVIESVHVIAKKEASDNGENMMANAIRNSTRMNLELGVSINILNKMTLKKPFEELIPNTIGFYRQKMALNTEMAKIASEFIGGSPKKNVDYAKYAARMPEISARLESIDKAIFQSSVLFFGLLVDMNADSENHVSHLLITKVERQGLVDKINRTFGNKLDQVDQNYTVSAAWVLRSYLLKDFKSSDEPW